MLNVLLNNAQHCTLHGQKPNGVSALSWLFTLLPGKQNRMLKDVRPNKLNFSKLKSWNIGAFYLWWFVPSKYCWLASSFQQLFPALNRFMTKGHHPTKHKHWKIYCYRYIKGGESGAMTKKEIANMIQRRRKIGANLPPVYPNGWFRLLDSNQLSNGEVKEVCALGRCHCLI